MVNLNNALFFWLSLKAMNFVNNIGKKANRKLKAQRKSSVGIWFGLGLMGIIGWSVVVPTLLGTALGLWLDKHYPGQHAWTLALLMAGLITGCWIAWFWLDKESRSIHDEQANHHEP